MTKSTASVGELIEKLEACHAPNLVHEALDTGAIQPLWQNEALLEKTPQGFRPAHRAQLGVHARRVVRKDT